MHSILTTYLVRLSVEHVILFKRLPLDGVLYTFVVSLQLLWNAIMNDF